MKSDILIIGGGVIGLSIAHELHQQGVKSITLVEKGTLGNEASRAAAGMLAPSSETEKNDDFYALCVESNSLYPHLADQLLVETGIDIEFDPSGTLYLAFNDNDIAEEDRRFRVQSGIGVNISRLDRRQILEIEPNVSSEVISGLLYADDRQVENRKLLDALKRYAEINDIKIVENCEIASIEIENDRVIGARTAAGLYHAGHTVLATGAWTSLIKLDNAAFPVRIRPIRGQILSFKAVPGSLKKVIYSPRGYMVPRTDGRLLAGATVEDCGFDSGTTKEGLEQLRRSASEIAPMTANLEVSESWAGLRPLSDDEHPILGRFAGLEDLTIATGHYRNGILLAPLTARLTADSIVAKKDHRYLEIFGPDRFITARKKAGN